MARLPIPQILALTVAAAALVTPAAGQGRVVILGVDGMDHALTRELIAEGALPELAALAREGSFGRLLPTNPAQSPTSWATLTTGLNPGGHGVFGFLRRRAEPDGIRAEVALAAPVEEPILTAERFAFGIENGGIQFPVFVLEDSEARNLLRQPLGLGFRVPPGDPEQDQKSLADP